MNHPTFELENWKQQFPLADFEKREGPRKFASSEPGDPIDLWKASGRIISSPVDLAVTEQIRERAAQTTELGTAVPADVFVWSAGEPDKPYLTKVGGVPHREKSKPWPKSRAGKATTFVVQFCFLDSMDLVKTRLPGDVMLVFFETPDSCFSRESIQIEWSDSELAEPVCESDCPAPSFAVPRLAGVRHRTVEYPKAKELFRRLGHYQYWLLATTQSTKIGSETWFIQSDVRRKGEILLCTFNSLQLSKKWPFANAESMFEATSKFRTQPADFDHMMFGDVGCFYFLLDKKGKVRWEFDCY